MDESLRLQRLEMLADLWGRILLFHPAVLRSDLKIDWNEVFTSVLPRIEQAEDAIELARVLNDKLFHPLNDPLTFAQPLPASPGISAQGPATSSLPDRCDTSILCTDPDVSPGVRWIVLSDPAVLQSSDFPAQLSRILKSLSSVNLLLVDLRWSTAHEDNIPSGFLGYWAGSTCHSEPKISRVHCGWHEFDWPYVYSHKWEVTAGRPLQPVTLDGKAEARKGTSIAFGKPFHLGVPTIFLINNGSILHLTGPLSALCSQAHVRVVWERTGRFSIPISKTLRYPEGVAVHLNTSAFGFLPHVIVDEPVSADSLDKLRSLAFDAAGGRPGRGFLPTDFLASEAEVPKRPESESLSRAERLLGLIKIWSVLKHFFPHFSQASLTCDRMLPEWIPRAEAASGLKEYLVVLEEMAAKLNDGHAAIAHSSCCDQEGASMPVELGMRAGRIVVLRAPKNAGVSVGEEVLDIDGRSMDQLLEWGRRRISASSEQAFLRRLFQCVCRGEEGSCLHLTVRHQGATRKVALSLTVTSPSQLESGTASILSGFAIPEYARAVQILENRFGYMAPFELSSVSMLDGAFEMVRDADGLILDLRGYPRAHFQHALVRRLCSGTISSPRYEIPLIKEPHPTEFLRVTIVYRVSPQDENPVPRQYSKPAVALINEEVESSAEDFCMYLRIAGRVTFVGRATAGCHGNAAFIRLPAGIQMSFTGMLTTWPDGSPFKGIGIVPDVEVPATLDSLVEGRDEILEKGVETLKGLIANQ